MFLIENTTHLDENKLAGTEVFVFKGCDYLCAITDTKFFGETYVTVTEDLKGGLPFFTVPLRILSKSE